MSTMEEPPPADSEPAAEEDQANGSSFMSLCLAATNRLLVEKHDVPADEQGQDVLVSGSIVPDADVDVSAPTQDCEPIMERFMCYEDIKNVTDDSILKPADVAAAAKKPKQSAVRKGTPTKGRRYVSGIRSGSKRDDQWNIMFLRLQDYKFENGTCNVPQGFAADAELATWVKNQRQSYRYMLERKTTKRISPERVTRLNHIGFEWRKYNKTEEEQARLRYNTKRHLQYMPPPLPALHPRIAVPMPQNHLPPAQYTHHPAHLSPYPMPPPLHQRIPPAGKLPYKPPPVARSMPSPSTPTYRTISMPVHNPNMHACNETMGTSTPGTATV